MIPIPDLDPGKSGFITAIDDLWFHHLICIQSWILSLLAFPIPDQDPRKIEIITALVWRYESVWGRPKWAIIPLWPRWPTCGGIITLLGQKGGGERERERDRRRGKWICRNADCTKSQGLFVRSSSTSTDWLTDSPRNANCSPPKKGRGRIPLFSDAPQLLLTQKSRGLLNTIVSFLENDFSVYAVLWLECRPRTLEEQALPNQKYSRKCLIERNHTAILPSGIKSLLYHAIAIYLPSAMCFKFLYNQLSVLCPSCSTVALNGETDFP